MTVARLSYESERTRLDALTGAAEAGLLTDGMFSEAIRFIYEIPSAGNSRSLGVSWIRNRQSAWLYAEKERQNKYRLGDVLVTAESVAFLKPVIANVAAFVRAHLDVSEFTRAFVSDAQLLQLVSDSGEREEIFEQAFLAYGTWGVDWVSAALAAGIPLYVLERVVLERLRRTTADRDLQYNYATFAQDFLRYGDDRSGERMAITPDRPWPRVNCGEWGVFLSEESFIEALTICADKTPSYFLDVFNKITAWIGEEKALALVKKAIKPLTSVPRGLLKIEDKLDLETRWSLCDQLDPKEGDGVSARYIVDTLVRTKWEEGDAYVTTAMALLEQIDPVTVYRQATRAAHAREGALPPSIVARTQQRLTLDGCAVGNVTRGTFRRKGSTRDESQMELVVGNRVFVLDRDQHRYRAQEGDAVIVRMNGARFLTSRGGKQIYSAYFTPVLKDET